MTQPKITIETIPGPDFDDGSTYNWRDYKRILIGKTLKPGKAKEWPNPAKCPLPEEVLTERHHHHYGRSWLLGRYAFEHLLGCGLKPEDRVLDIGCGAGRLGIHLIRLLDTGNYFGLDAHKNSLRAFAEYEIFLNGLIDKRPRLLRTRDFAADHFGVAFKWMIDISTTIHLPDKQLLPAFRRLATALATEGRLFCSPPARLSSDDMIKLGLVFEREVRQDCPLLHGHRSLDPVLHWGEYRKVESIDGAKDAAQGALNVSLLEMPMETQSPSKLVVPK